MEEKVSERFKVSAARLITVLFHPLFMPVYGLVVIFTAPTLFFYLPPGVKKILLMILLINNIFIPVALIPFFRYRNIISSWIMEERNDRIVPLIFVSILYIITSFIIIKFNIPPLIKSYICSISVLSLIILI
ncbi:MAG: hypothetical protein ACUVTX_10330, partial [Bacteroidales bacterium]